MNLTTTTTTTVRRGEGRFIDDELTPGEKHKQAIFAMSVAIGVVAFLLIIIGHAAIGHIRERRR